MAQLIRLGEGNESMAQGFLFPPRSELWHADGQGAISKLSEVKIQGFENLPVQVLVPVDFKQNWLGLKKPRYYKLQMQAQK